jgi:hypothetical protein
MVVPSLTSVRNGAVSSAYLRPLSPHAGASSRRVLAGAAHRYEGKAGGISVGTVACSATYGTPEPRAESRVLHSSQSRDPACRTASHLRRCCGDTCASSRDFEVKAGRDVAASTRGVAAFTELWVHKWQSRPDDRTKLFQLVALPKQRRIGKPLTSRCGLKFHQSNWKVSHCHENDSVAA